jgi:hypothetical protein
MSGHGVTGDHSPVTFEAAVARPVNAARPRARKADPLDAREGVNLVITTDPALLLVINSYS